MVIKKAEFVTSAVNLKGMPEDGKVEFMFCGRSNVGKSSFINMLLNRKNLARTSSKPGKTQTLNIFNINDDFYFVDVPGYGYANVSKSVKQSFGKMIEEYVKKSENLKMVFLLVDYRHKPTEDDVLMYDFLKYYNIDVTIIATKYDKVSKNGRVKQDKLIKDTLKLGEDGMFIPFSTITKKGKEDVYSIIEEILKGE